MDPTLINTISLTALTYLARKVVGFLNKDIVLELHIHEAVSYFLNKLLLSNDVAVVKNNTLYL